MRPCLVWGAGLEREAREAAGRLGAQAAEPSRRFDAVLALDTHLTVWIEQPSQYLEVSFNHSLVSDNL